MRNDALDDNRSCWLDEAPAYAPLPPLRGAASADVAVIGGGFTGVSTAWHLSRRFPERRIVLLEARALANGASGRNGGQLLNWINGVDSDDPATAASIFAATRSGIDLVAELVARYGIDAGFDRRGCIEVCTTARGAEAAARRVERMRAAGIPLEWLPASAAGLHGAHGAVRDPTAGRVNGAALLRGLRPTLLAQGVAVHEQTPVLRVEPGVAPTLITPHGRVRAAALVLATNGYTPALGFFRDRILPLHSHVLATVPLAPVEWNALGWGAWDGFTDDLDRIAYGHLSTLLQPRLCQEIVRSQSGFDDRG
jgi:glycine/D-amino acid oxidase-like deaminating enzyme